jgi:transposase-like protein
MPRVPTICPNSECEFHATKTSGFFRKKGTYTPKCRGRALTRYQCKACGKTFSNQTSAKSVRQHKPEINAVMAKLICSGVTLRRAAWILGCRYTTVSARVPWLAERAREAHAQALKGESLKTSFIQFDEMQTFEHAAPKALTIALAVRAKTGQILSVKVGRIPANGHLADIGKSKYAWTVNESAVACLAALTQAALAAKPGITVMFDGAPTYPGLVAKAMPGAHSKVAEYSEDGFDPLYRINHLCAKIRADVATMARRTWSTTKSRSSLQDRLDIFVAVNNGYHFC